MWQPSHRKENLRRRVLCNRNLGKTRRRPFREEEIKKRDKTQLVYNLLLQSFSDLFVLFLYRLIVVAASAPLTQWRFAKIGYSPEMKKHNNWCFCFVCSSLNQTEKQQIDQAVIQLRVTNLIIRQIDWKNWNLELRWTRNGERKELASSEKLVAFQ